LDLRKTSLVRFVSKVAVMLLCCVCRTEAGAFNKADAQDAVEIFPIRAFHVTRVNRELSNTWFYHLIDQLSERNYNMLIMGLGGEHATAYVIPEPGKIEFLVASREEMVDVIRRSRDAGIEPVLEVKIIGKQPPSLGALAKQYPGLLIEGSGYMQWGVVNPAFRFPDGRDPYEAVILPMLDEMISLYGDQKPTYLLLGIDEFSPDQLAAAGKPLGWDASRVFAEGLNRCVDHLIRQGITPIIWGDMLLSSRLAESGHGVEGFKQDPRFTEAGPYHAEAPGRNTGMSVLTAVNGIQNRDRIVVAHWQYETPRNGYPAVDYFQQLGFKEVWGATWYSETAIQEFARYAAARRCGGMVATSWHTSFNKSVKHLFRPILDNSSVYFANPDFAPPAEPAEVRMGPDNALVDYPETISAKVIRQTREPIRLEIPLPEGQIPQEAEFWLTDKRGAELVRMPLQYRVADRTLYGEFMLPERPDVLPHSLDMGYRYRCAGSGYLVQKFCRAGLIIAAKEPVAADPVASGVLLQADFSQFSTADFAGGVLAVSGRHGGILLLENNGAASSCDGWLDMETVDAAYMYPGAGFWKEVVREGMRVDLDVKLTGAVKGKYAAVLNCGHYGGGFRLLLSHSNMLTLQCGPAARINISNALPLDQWSQIQFALTPPNAQGERTLTLKVNDQTGKTVLFSEPADPDDNPLGIGTGLKRWSRDKMEFDLFPGHIRQVIISTY